jgi:Leucine-rich repeat (LRR) protein
MMICSAGYLPIVKLEELYICHINIEVMSAKAEGSVRSLMNVKILDVSYNQLQQLSRETEFLPKLEKLAFGNNKLKVLCEVKHAHEFCVEKMLRETEIPE